MCTRVKKHVCCKKFTDSLCVSMIAVYLLCTCDTPIIHLLYIAYTWGFIFPMLGLPGSAVASRQCSSPSPLISLAPPKPYSSRFSWSSFHYMVVLVASPLLPSLHLPHNTLLQQHPTTKPIPCYDTFPPASPPTAAIMGPIRVSINAWTSFRTVMSEQRARVARSRNTGARWEGSASSSRDR